MKTTKTKYPYVYRAVYPEQSLDGYIAKVIRRTTRLHKAFQLADYKGDHKLCIAAAAKAAAAFAKKNPRLSRREIAELPHKKKDDDLPQGVRRVTTVVKGFIYDFYEAEWSPVPNRQVKRKFSVNLYGEDEALERAIDARQRGLEEMED